MPMVFSTTMFAFYVLFVMWGVMLVSPLFLSVSLVLTSLSAGALLGLRISWFFYALALVFLGGMMVLILYIAALSENDKFCLQPGALKLSWGGLGVAGLTAGSLTHAPTGMAPVSLLVLLSGAELPLWGSLLAYLLTVLFLAVKAAQGHKGALTKFL